MRRPSPCLVRIHPRDDVLVLARSVRAGETVDLEGTPVTVPEDLGLGHKLAARRIGRGEKVRKYGLPIGTAVRDIAVGEHVHVHNLRSDYLPTRLRESGGRSGGEG